MIDSIFIRMDVTPSEMHRSDLSEFLLEKTKQLYEKRCFKKRYIIEVIRIIYEGEIVIQPFNLSSNGSIDMEIEIKFLYFSEGDIITNCKIGNIDTQGRYICTNEFMNARIKVAKPIYKVGRIIPIVVKGCKFTNYNNKMSIFGTDIALFSSEKLHLKVADVPDAVSEDNFNRLHSEMLELESELELLQKNNLKNKFNELLFPISKEGRKVGSIKKFKEVEGKCYSIGIRPTDDDNYYEIEDTMCASASAADVHATLIQARNKSLRNMISLLSWYDDEKFEADSDIWKLMNV
jgi:hypothetical protein